MVGVEPFTFAHAWEVLLLFLIPIGGGIPGGVVLAQKFGFSWQIMMILYFISDAILACTFEPLMLLFLRASENSPKLLKIRQVLAKSTASIIARHGRSPGPFTLVMIAFGTDPMTGRMIAKIAGHEFFAGWAIAIAGDLIFFSVLMASTIWLNNVLGDGTLAAIIVTLIIVFAPTVISKLRGRSSAASR